MILKNTRISFKKLMMRKLKKKGKRRKKKEIAW
jgi:hypothetical protein